MICTDWLLGCRRDLLVELIATNLSTYHLFSFHTLGTVYRITGEQDNIPPSEVTTTDSLHLLVRN